MTPGLTSVAPSSDVTRPAEERRIRRSADPEEALRLALSGSNWNSQLRAVFVSDADGNLVARSHGHQDLTLLSVLLPLVGAGRVAPAVKRAGLSRDLTVRRVEVNGEALFVGALGGQRGGRILETARSSKAIRRILGR